VTLPSHLAWQAGPNNLPKLSVRKHRGTSCAALVRTTLERLSPSPARVAEGYHQGCCRCISWAGGL
jgi:hypothetical protein